MVEILCLKNKAREVLFVLLCGLCISNTWALKPAEVEIRGYYATPVISIKQRYVDNLYYEAGPKSGSWITELSGDVEASSKINGLENSLLVSFIAGSFALDPADNYLDLDLTLRSGYEFNHRNRVNFETTISRDHDDRGTELSEGASVFEYDEPLQYHSALIKAGYVLGSNSSRGNLQFNLSFYDKSYTNFSNLTDEYNYSSVLGGATFRWRVGKTSFLSIVEFNDIDYKNDPLLELNNNILDRYTQRYLMGISWGASNKVTLDAKYGLRYLDFVDGSRKDFTGPTWNMLFIWSPTLYSVMSVSGIQEDRESTGDGNFIDYSEIRLDWKNLWTSYIQTEMYFLLFNKSFEGSRLERKDENHELGVSIIYNVRRWIDCGMSLSSVVNDSSVNIFDFERNSITIFLDVSL